MNVLRSSLSLLAAGILLAGCNVSHNSHGDGDNVQVRTPFGNMHIKTSADAAVAGIGLSTYPGSVPVKDDKDDDAADINLNFGDFHLGVKAASYQTADSPDKVEAFYRKDMARYGDVLKCRGDNTIGQPARTAEGLACSDNDSHGIHSVHVDDDSDHVELRAGSPQHEHIVGIEPKDGGTKIGLVALDLPSHHDASDSE